MTDVSTILGIALIGVGAASAVYGAILCYTTKVGLKRCIFRIRNVSRLDVVVCTIVCSEAKITFLRCTLLGKIILTTN